MRVRLPPAPTGFYSLICTVVFDPARRLSCTGRRCIAIGLVQTPREPSVEVCASPRRPRQLAVLRPRRPTPPHGRNGQQVRHYRRTRVGVCCLGSEKTSPCTCIPENVHRLNMHSVPLVCLFFSLPSWIENRRLRLWQAETGRNTMTNYLQTKNKRRRPFGMTVVKPAGKRSETASLDLFRQRILPRERLRFRNQVF